MRKVGRRDLPAAAKAEADQLVVLMRQAEPTAFALEGAAVAGLRAQRCLAGWAWAAADLVARDIVRVALNHAGAVRPSWADGQPLPPADPDRLCESCGTALYHLQIRWCSARCRQLDDSRARKAIIGAARAAARVGLHCVICGVPLVVKRQHAKTCGSICRRRLSRLGLRGAGPRPLRAGSAEAG